MTEIERWFREFGPTTLEESMFDIGVQGRRKDELSHRLREYEDLYLLWIEATPGSASMKIGIQHDPMIAHIDTDPIVVLEEYLEENRLLEWNSAWCVYLNLQQEPLPQTFLDAAKRYLREQDGWK